MLTTKTSPVNKMCYCLSDYVSFHSAASAGNLTSRIKGVIDY